MTYYEKLKNAVKEKEQFHVYESGIGDTRISYLLSDGKVLFSVSIIPAGVRSSVLDEDFQNTRFRNLSQGEIGDNLLTKVRGLVEDPEDVQVLVDVIEKVVQEYLEG